LATIDRIYIATNVNQNVSGGTGSQGDKDLVRYEFLEIIVRLANAKYKDSGVTFSTSEAVRKILEDNIFPNIEQANA
jgi:histidine ammonia-lyase